MYQIIPGEAPRREDNHMITNEDRIRAFVGNIKQYDWGLFPVYKLEREDALALLSALTTEAAIKAKGA